MVNKENVRKWVDALRSGEYAQTTGVLFRDSGDDEAGYCCLGVACDLSGLGQWIEDEDDQNEYGYSTMTFVVDGVDGYIDQQGATVLPMAVADGWLGIPDTNPSVLVGLVQTPSGLPESLASLNDAGLTFDQIADVITYEYLTGASA